MIKAKSKFEGSKWDKDTKDAPEGSAKDKAKDKVEKAKFVKRK